VTDRRIERWIAEHASGTRLTRREWLAASVAAAGGLAAHRLLAQQQPAVVEGLVIRNERALDAEAPLSALASPITPAEHRFVRSHFGPPDPMPRSWSLTIDGLVGRTTVLSLADLRAAGAESRTITTECAGNGRGLFALPKTSGVQWERGAVSTATWTGVPLGTLLERAGVAAGAQHFWMEAADRAPVPAVPKFLRSLPRDVAVEEAFVAYAMNGGPIPLLHGGPLRLLVPGWYGMASTKWLTHVHARGTESDNHFMARSYRHPDGSPVTRQIVKSLIAAPLAGARVPVGRIVARGQAWTGTGRIARVDVSRDGGATWAPARLVGTDAAGAWRGWELDLDVAQAGPQRVMARATDTTGAVQPVRAEPNPSGYGNNSIHEVRFDAVRA
jgi:DMSO/TMAO reductase YedYZ molybdopterin-dependent catalytic subunit